MKLHKIVILLAGALPLAAQTIDLTKPPVSPEQKPYKLPPVTEMKLPNGLTVVIAEDPRFPLVTAKLSFAAGTKVDPKELPGLASAAGFMLGQGTKTRTYRQIAEELDGMGGSMGTSSGQDSTGINASVLAESLPRMLALMADVARNAAFPETELALYKANQKQGILVQHSRPEFLAQEEFRKRIFGDHPYSRVSTTPEALDKLDRAALMTFHDTYLVPNNAYLILVGKLPARAALTKLISEQFGTWAKKDFPAYAPAMIPAPKKQLVIVDKPGSVQADVQIGKVAANFQDPLYMAETMGSVTLGGGPNSRLFLDIREKRGYAYDVHTEQLPLADAGIFSVVTQVRNEVAPDAVQGILTQMGDMAKERVTREELSGAKSLVNGLFLLRLEPQRGLADQLEKIKLLHLPKDYLETFTTKVNSVEPDQIVTAAKKFIAPEDDVVVIVGDAAKIEKGLSDKLGKFEVVKPKQ